MNTTRIWDDYVRSRGVSILNTSEKASLQVIDTKTIKTPQTQNRVFRPCAIAATLAGLHKHH